VRVNDFIAVVAVREDLVSSLPEWRDGASKTIAADLNDRARDVIGSLKARPSALLYFCSKFMLGVWRVAFLGVLSDLFVVNDSLRQRPMM
jgi:hypothetical protein